MAWLEFILLISIWWSFAYYRMPAYVWAPTSFIVLGMLAVFGHINLIVLAVLGFVFLSSVFFLLVPGVRRYFITKRLLSFFHRQLPSMGQTEREALDAGDVWWEGELFAGRPDWQKLHAMPTPTLTDAEQAFIDNQTETLCSMLDDWQIIHQDKDLSPAVWDYLKQEGFFGLVIEKEYGGHGFSALAHSSIVTKIATRSLSAAVNMMVPNSLGPAELIHQYGTEQQKTHYLPRLASGEEIPCFCLTAPDAGSDASSITDTGVVCKGEFEGQEVLGIRLNWDKHYISLAPIATVLGMAIQLVDPDRLLGKNAAVGITLCLIPVGTPGVTTGRRHFPLNLAFMNGPTQGKDVFIPMDWIIGGAEQAGKGWQMLMECLSIGRSISLPAMSSACAQLSYRMTGAYARIRRQFNQPIGYFEGVEAALARIGGYSYMIEATRLFTAGAVMQGVRPAVASAIAKYHMTEMGRVIVNDAMDVHGGRGIQTGPRNYLATGYMAIPISITVEGANILTRSLIIFGQGSVRCHPYIRDEIAASEDEHPERALDRFDQLLFSHLGYTKSNALRCLFMGLTCGGLIQASAKGRVKRYYQQLTRMSTALAYVSDIAMLLLGGQLKRKEHLSARLGDILSNLYLASAVLKYYSDQGEIAEDEAYMQWCLETCLYRIQTAFDEIFTNFPLAKVGKMLRFMVFPYGQHYRQPKDSVLHQIARSMLAPSAFRDRMTASCYVNRKPGDVVGRMELALDKVIEAKDVEMKLLAALKKGHIANEGSIMQRIDNAEATGVLNRDEATLLREAEAARHDAVIVDDFLSEELMGNVK